MANKVPLAIADLELQLATALAVGGTSFTLSGATDDDGTALPAGLYCFTVDNGTSNKEYLIGQLNSTSVTSVKSVSRQGVESTGAARKHRIGAPVILTDFATLQRVADILRGQVDLDGANPIGYDAEPTLADRKDLATVGYVLDIVSGGTVAFDAQTIAGNGGEAIVDGNLAYFKTSDQEWYKTDADTAATVEGVQLGITLGSGSDGVAITGGVQISGTYTTTGLTAGATYYASNTAGGISTSAGTTSRVIGVALSTTKLLLIPRTPQDIKDAQKAAMAGGGAFGTPSATNLFVTEDKMNNASTLALVRTVATGSTTKNLADASGTQTIAHGLGTTPTYVSIKMVSPDLGTNSGFSFGEWYTGGYVTSMSVSQSEGGSNAQEDGTFVSTSNILRCISDPQGLDYQTATIAVDATNITLTWTKTNSPAGTWSTVWLAKAETITYS